MQKNLFTIAIPTYNRAKYLQECLLHITNQLNIQNQEIDIIVSDNCSTDNTQEVVEKYIQFGYTISYIKNETNKGADFNIAQCYQLAKTQFVLALGDDDYLNELSINKINTILLNNKDAGIVHLLDRKNNNFYYNNFCFITKNKYLFIKKINYWVSFISTNIVNKNYITNINYNLFLNSQLNQIHIYITAIYNAPYNIYYREVLFTYEQHNNPLSFNPFQIFGINFGTLLNSIQKSFIPLPLSKLIFPSILNNLLPEMILNYKKKYPKNFKQLKITQELYNIYKSYPAFWIYFIPIYYMPYKMGLNYFKTLQNIQKLFNKLTKK